jgi:hypothetical protein
VDRHEKQRRRMRSMKWSSEYIVSALKLIGPLARPRLNCGREPRDISSTEMECFKVYGRDCAFDVIRI